MVLENTVLVVRLSKPGSNSVVAQIGLLLLEKMERREFWSLLVAPRHHKTSSRELRHPPELVSRCSLELPYGRAGREEMAHYSGIG